MRRGIISPISDQFLGIIKRDKIVIHNYGNYPARTSSNTHISSNHKLYLTGGDSCESLDHLTLSNPKAFEFM